MLPERADPPSPTSDGASHLAGMRLPALELPTATGARIALDALPDLAVLFIFPGIGGPANQALLDEWMGIPGAYGCTSEACGFRDHVAEFRERDAAVVGLSAQSAERLRQAIDELELPYPLLSDERLLLAETLRLPTFTLHEARYYKRLTLIIKGGVIDAALYPVSPPGDAAEQALHVLAGGE
jgi:peroxiredoxin